MCDCASSFFELAVNVGSHVEVLGFAFGNIVKLLLKRARVVILKEAKVAFQRVDEQDAEIRGPQNPLRIVNVVAGDDVLEDGRVGEGRPIPSCSSFLIRPAWVWLLGGRVGLFSRRALSARS
jgi:hypothetical protein